MMNYAVSDTRCGSKTLTAHLQGSDRDIKLHSAYDPVKESERNVSSFNAGKCSVIAVSGMALGYHIAFLKARFPYVSILVIENSADVVSLCSEHNPSSLENVTIINSEDDLLYYFQSVNLSDFRGISHYIHRPSYQLNAEFYDSILSSLKLLISSKVSDLLTRFEFEEKWIKNILINMKWLERTPGVSVFFNRFKGYPGIIVSAGPSLRSELDFLKTTEKAAVIVAVDTAFKVLNKSGVTPHFVMTLDAQKYSYKHFTGIHPDKTVLVADMVSCPAVLEHFEGRKIISTTSKYYQDSDGRTQRETTPVMDWVEKHTKAPGDIQSGGSVATSAFDLLLNMGCNPIILFGQDLAYTGREIHCSGTYHNDDWLPQLTRTKNFDTINQNVIRKRKIKYVTRFRNNGRVISDFVFDLYKSWFEDSAGRVSVKVINSNSGGSRISNTEEIDSQDLKLKKFTETPFDIINKVYGEQDCKINRNMNHKLEEISQKLDQIIETYESDLSVENKYLSVNTILDDCDLNALMKPLMRKAEFYTSRNSLEEGRSNEMLFNEIKLNSIKLKSFIKRSLLDNSGYAQT